MDDNLNGALLRVASAFESVILAFGDLGSTNVLTTSLDALASSLRLVSRHIDRVRQIATAAAIALGVRFVASQKKAIVESLNTARANRTALAREVERTAAVRDLTRWQYEEARASARGLAGTTRAAAAHGKAAAASRAHAAAQAQLAAVTRTTTVAMRGLNTAMAFLGGPVGVALLVIYAIYEFVSASDDMAASADRSAESIEELRKRLEGLHEAERQLEFIRAKRQLEEFQNQLRAARADFDFIAETPQRFSYATQIESLTNLVLATEKGIDLYERHIEIQRSLGIESDKTAREVERLKTSLEDLSRQKIEVDAGELARLNTQLEFYEKSSKQIETGDQGFLLRLFGPSLEEVLSRIVELRRRIGESQQTIHKAGEEAEDTARKFDELGAALDASEEFTKLRERLEKLFNPLNKISEEYEANTKLITENTKEGSNLQVQLLALAKVQKEATKADVFARSPAGRASRRAEDLRFEIDLLNRTAEAQAVLTELRRTGIEATLREGQTIENLIAGLDAEAQALGKNTLEFLRRNAAIEQSGRIQDVLRNLQSEAALVSRNAEEQAIINTLRQAGVDVTIQQGQALEDYIKLLPKEAKELAGVARENFKLAETGQKHQQAVQSIESQLDALLPAYGRAVAQANRWRDEALAGLDPLQEGYESFRMQVGEIYEDLIKRAREAQQARDEQANRTPVLEALERERALQQVHSRQVDLGLATRDTARATALWVREMRTALLVGLKVGEPVDAATQAILDQLDAIEKRARRLASDDPLAGLRIGLEQYAAQLPSVAEQINEATLGALRGMEDALVGFVQTGKLEFGSLVDSILADLARIAIRQAIVGPLSSALSEVFGGGGEPQVFRLQHGGLIHGPGGPKSDSILARVSDGEFVVNAAATQAHLPLLEAINATSRFHEGGPVGVPITALPVPTVAGGGTVVQVIDNRTTSPDDESLSVSDQRGPDGRRTVQIVIDDAVNSSLRSGRYDSALRTRYGVRPSIAQR